MTNELTLRDEDAVMTLTNMYLTHTKRHQRHPHTHTHTRGAKKCIHILRDVIYLLLFEVELNYGIAGRSLKRWR